MIDDAIRARALDPSVSFLVQAPAGSGKTELLIRRYLRLLAEVEYPEAVVAITFTRKAASEMRARVLNALRAGDTPLASAVLERDRQLSWQLARNPARLRIETIDALCAGITRSMPWLARFGSQPEVTERPEDLYREAARATLSLVAEEERAARLGPISTLLLHLDNDFGGAETLIARMLERRDQWLRHTGTGRNLAHVRTALEESLSGLVSSSMERLRRHFSEPVAHDIAALLGWDSLPGISLADAPRWQAVANLLLTKGGDFRKRVDTSMGFPANHPLKTRCQNLLARVAGDNALLEALRDFRELPDARFEDQQWSAMQAVIEALMLAVAHLEVVFRERGRVDFTEVSLSAARALGSPEDPTDLGLAVGYRIQHLLVDEFQDTSYTQFDLLRKLTAGWSPGDGRTLFLVGDPMQSIYRFRQAEVGLFLKAREQGIGGVKMEPLALAMNFRSTTGIVEWVNSTFPAVLPEEEDIDSGAVAFHASSAARPAGPDAPAVEIHAATDSLDEAARIVGILERPANGTTAVLVRARMHLGKLVPALKRRGIRFQAIEIDQLGDRPVIQDLMALTFALLHPADRVSWLAILRAPWCGLSLADLAALTAGEPWTAVWDLLPRLDRLLSPDGAERIARILPVLEQAVAARGRRPLREWVEGCWLLLGGPACVSDDSALDDAAAYFNLIEGLDEGSDVSDFANLRREVEALFAQPDPQASGDLQLMTIHKAKGLEFDTVILPGLGNLPKRDDAPLLQWLEHSGELLLAPISRVGQPKDKIYDYLTRIERRKTELETARLLYVAVTRAREKLHLLAVAQDKAAKGSFVEHLWPAFEGVFLRNAKPAPPLPEPAIAMRTIRRLPAAWKLPAPPPAVKWTLSRLEPVEPVEISFHWAGDTLRHAGTVLHELLSRIAREGLEGWKPPDVRPLLKGLGVPPLELDGTAARVEQALDHVLRDPQARWILSPHDEAESEWALAGLIDGKLYQAVIDRSFIDRDGTRWIIDYKTSAHTGAGVEEFLDNEKLRYQPQLERYARLLAQRESRPMRLALYFPLLSGWREWTPPGVQLRQASLF
ncbi:MAG: UvrD-helicase domain-containing protein [Acidobacteriota bacterium]|nr:UvrD-helicase domain-containing protein [Acidobacteriota bacterium]